MRLGFVGVGNMGGPMAANLVAAGHDLVVFDTRREVADELIVAGAVWADSPRAVAEAGVDAVLLSLPTPPIVEAVVTGPDGVLAGCTAGQTVIDLSTNAPAVVQQLAAVCAQQGVGFLDAPVSGGVRGARDGTLAVMVGGDAAQFDRFRPAFEAIGARVFHLGGVGAGNVAKLINNQLAFVGMMGTIEAIVLGGKAGLDPVVLRDLVSSSSGASSAWDNATRVILKDRLRPTFTVELAAKDIGLAQQLAAEQGVETPMGAAANAVIRGFLESGYADEDLIATVKAVEERSGFVVRGTWHD
jgi:2-hydroxymethylglutarate dehydrogenase